MPLLVAFIGLVFAAGTAFACAIGYAAWVVLEHTLTPEPAANIARRRRRGIRRPQEAATTARGRGVSGLEPG